MPRFVAVAAVVLLGLLSGCTAASTGHPVVRTAEWATPSAFGDAAGAVAVLPSRHLATGITARTASGIAPPTNRWYSGMVFGSTPNTVYPFPLAVQPALDGFTYSLPEVSASATTVAAPLGAGLNVGLAATDYTVTHADPVAVTARYADSSGALGDLTLAEGWPVVGFTAARATTLRPSADLRPVEPGVWTTTVSSRAYGVVSPHGVWQNGALHVPAHGTAQWFAIPPGSSAAAWARALTTPITGVTTAFRLTESTASTELAYAGPESTVLVPPPGAATPASCDLGTFHTAYGVARACAAASLRWSVPRVDATASYDFSHLTAPDRSALARQVRADLTSTPRTLPTDSYAGGKAVARLATLWEIAHSAGRNDVARAVAARLEKELLPWTQRTGCATRSSRCFVYDPTLRTVVGEAPSFGSEEGNDHHFHYGYFLYAASVLATARPADLARLRPVIDAVAADIATGEQSSALSALRTFDPYRGHSWASGLAPFADGNNQESSSEAVNAWNGLALWARITRDKALESQATWMLSTEASAARSQWLRPEGLPAGFAHRIVSLNWGGKRDYATWFSAQPSAILGIQLIPLSRVASRYLPRADVSALVAEAGGASAYTRPLGDFVLMYSALGGSKALADAKAALTALPASAIDAGNSRSAILAWIDSAPDTTRAP